MKYILTSLVVLVLILTIISGILKRFKPDYVEDDRWKKTGLIVASIFLAIMGGVFVYNPERSNLNKLVTPIVFFIIFLDIYRRSRK